MMNFQTDSLADARQTLFIHFPNALPGETLFSICARFHRLSAIKRPALTSMLLMGNSRAASKKCVPAGLGLLVQTVPDVFGSVPRLLQEHTHGALYLRFMQKDQQHRCTSACTASFHQRERLPFGWASSKFEVQHPLRFCRSCSASDQDLFGTTYWHLEHQLPGILICAKHMEALRIDVRNIRQNRWYLPDISSQLTSAIFREQHAEGLACLADTVQSMCGPTRANLEALRTLVCTQLEQIGIAQASRAINESKLRNWISSIFNRLGSPVLLDSAGSSVWPDAVAGILGKRLAHHPLRWAFLIAGLRLEGALPVPFYQAMNKECQIALPGFKNPETPTSPDIAFEAVEDGASIQEICMRLQTTRSVVERWFKNPAVHKVWISARRRKIQLKHEEALRKALSFDNLSRQEIRNRANAAYQWFTKNDPIFLDALLQQRHSHEQLTLWPVCVDPSSPSRKVD